MQGIYVFRPDAFPLVYTARVRAEIERRVRIVAEPQTSDSVRANPSLLAGVDLLFAGWGGPEYDAAFLRAAPELKVVFHAAGNVMPSTAAALAAGGVRITCAADVNARPVAQYTLSQVLFCLRRGWHFARCRENRPEGWPPTWDIPGGHGATIGIIGLGRIGREVCRLLRPFRFQVLGYDPFAPDGVFAAARVRRVSLDELFRGSDVVTIHALQTESTRGMVTGELVRLMKRNASLINTSRGSLIREAEALAVFAERPDLQAVFDVTDPEPPAPDSPIWRLPNVTVTPHIAGSTGPECEQLGLCMAAELSRFLAGKPLKHEVTATA